MIYLASPYSHADPAVMEQRFYTVAEAAGHLMLRGIIAFCPIAHSHPIFKMVPATGARYEDWARMDEEMIDYCKEVWVLMLDGWEVSRGVNAEMEYAKSKGYPVRLVDPDLLQITRTL